MQLKLNTVYNDNSVLFIFNGCLCGCWLVMKVLGDVSLGSAFLTLLVPFASLIRC